MFLVEGEFRVGTVFNLQCLRGNRVCCSGTLMPERELQALLSSEVDTRMRRSFDSPRPVVREIELLHISLKCNVDP